ncbi:iron ABC transporter substrate-binding protein [Modestobacter sp. Leaf380]|nr:iron ABC transporter substrate-binding protein [Modestobacter sp. Leaf380]
MLAAVSALVLSGCGTSEEPAATAESDSASASSFPLTIEHALGETVIEEVPTRVVTWGFSDADAVLALGVVPVAMPTVTYGANPDGVLPWIQDAVDEAVAGGAEAPTLLPDSTEVPFEAIAAAAPDVILATYSGLTQEEYDTLTDIAPTVAYADEPWTTPWRDVVTGVGEVLGREEQAAELVADTEQLIADAAAAHPELEGATVAAVSDFSGTFYVYEEADPRVEFLTDLGLQVAPSVGELSTGQSTFYYELSYEALSDLTSDVLLTYSEDRAALDSFLASPQAQTMSQVLEGRVAPVVGADKVSAVSPPTVLSLTYSLDDTVAALSAALAA